MSIIIIFCVFILINTSLIVFIIFKLNSIDRNIISECKDRKLILAYEKEMRDNIMSSSYINEELLGPASTPYEPIRFVP